MNEQNYISNRMFIILGFLLLIPVAITAQLLRINFVAGQGLRQLWSEQTIDTIPIPAKRGNIYDDDGRLLVTNSVAYNVAIDPHFPGISQKKIKRVSHILALNSSNSAQYYRHKINSEPKGSRYLVLAEDIPAVAYDSLQALDFRSVILSKEYERVYNYGKLAAHTLGYVNYAMVGQTGLEKEYNKKLKGTDGKQQVRRNGQGEISAYLGAPKTKPQEGYSLYTTLDIHIQAILQQELKEGVVETNSNYGTAIVLNTRTGAVKAIANYPTFNPNDLSTLSKDNQINHAVSDPVEPGSTFKLVTAIAAIETHNVTVDEKISTPPSGKLKIHGAWMNDHEPLGTMTFAQCIQESSNICVSKVAMRLSDDVFYQYARNLGFGTPTGIDLPNEAPGVLKKPYTWSEISLPWMSIGYGVEVTPIQLAQAYAAFANGGIMMQPFIVKKIVDGQGNVVMRHKPVKVRRVAKKETVKKLKPVFAGVVSDSGTAPKARVKGLPIAGKTGTAQEYINGQYRHIYRGLFVGFFPIKHPKYLCVVIMDKPDWPYFGGWTAAPVFHDVAKRIAGLDPDIERKVISDESDDKIWAKVPDVEGLRVGQAKALLRNMNLPYKINGSGHWVVDQKPNGGAVLKTRKKIILTKATTPIKADTTSVGKSESIVPDVTGMSMRRAAAVITKQNFKVRFIGSGTIYKQYPKPGATMQEGQTVLIRGKEPSLNQLASKSLK